MSLLDKLWRKQEVEPKEDTYDGKDDICVFSSKGNFGYDLKENRSEPVTYAGIGRTTYASGTPPQIYSDALDAFAKYPVVVGCVQAASDAISTLDIKVYKTKGGELVEDTKHEFYEIMRNPNPFQGGQEFKEQIVQHLRLFGNCFIAIEKGSPIELYVLNPQYISIIPDPKTKIKEYHYYINGQFTKYDPTEIIQIKYSSPSDPYFGAVPLSSAKDVLNLEKNRLAYAAAFFRNSATPAGILETDGTYSPTVLNKLRGEFERIHGGSAGFNRVAILSSGLKWKAVSSPLKDLDFKSLKELSNSDILTLYRTPAIVLGDLAESGSAEGKEALTFWWRNSLVPELRRIESALNRGLKDIVFGGGKYIFKFDLTTVNALQDDKVALSQYLERMVGSSVMTPNEARAVIGLPKSTGEYADELLVSNSFFGNQKMPIDAAAGQGAGSNEVKPSVQPKPKAKKDLDYALYDTARKLEELVKYLDD